MMKNNLKKISTVLLVSAFMTIGNTQTIHAWERYDGQHYTLDNWEDSNKATANEFFSSRIVQNQIYDVLRSQESVNDSQHEVNQSLIYGNEKRTEMLRKAFTELWPIIKNMTTNLTSITEKMAEDFQKNGIQYLKNEYEKFYNPTRWAYIGLGVFGLLTAYYAPKMIVNEIGRRLSTKVPELVTETSRTSSRFNAPLKTMKKMLGLNSSAHLSDIVLSQENETRVLALADAIKNTNKLKLPYENILFYGPPGTGKTEFVRLLAQHADMDYALLSADKFKQFKPQEAIQKMKELFIWARKGSRGTLLFIDECDSVFIDRKTLGEDGIALVNAFLAETGTSSDKFMVIFASNHPQKLDSAVRSRISNSYKFDLPTSDERLKIINKKLEKEVKGRKFYIIKDGKRQFKKLSIATELNDGYIQSIATRTDGFSGRTITQMIEAVRKSACLQGGVVTKAIFENEINEKIKKCQLDKQIDKLQE